MTLEKLAKRHSVRRYSDKPLTSEEISKIKAAITAVNSHEAGLHFSLVTNSPEAFKGFGRSYGLFSGVRNYIALVADKAAYEMIPEKVGYYAEMIVMRCVEMGLGTCFVAGTYSRKYVDVQLRAGWDIIALITVGHPADEREGFIARTAKKIVKRKSKAPLQFYQGPIEWEQAEKEFPKLLDALKAIALAPSALNRQPVVVNVRENDLSNNQGNRYVNEFYQIEAETRRFLLSPIYSNIHPELDFNSKYTIEAKVGDKSQLIDLGIAMWNFEQLFPGYWEWGNPARFIPCKEV